MVAGVEGEAMVVTGPLIHSPGTGKLKRLNWRAQGHLRVTIQTQGVVVLW